MAKIFSKRTAPQIRQLRYDIPDEVRTRILTVFQDGASENYGFHALLKDLGNALFKSYGYLSRSSYSATQRSENPVIEHFYTCELPHVLDFIETYFQQQTYVGRQNGVDEINDIFREHGIGYELMPYVEHESDKPAKIMGRLTGGKVIEIEYPRIIQRRDQLVHEQVIEPTLKLLTDSRFRIANEELLKAHTALRLGDFENAITLCGSAFESFLKTICSIRKWNFDPNRDTCAKLVSICRDNGLFPAFYSPIFEAIGTVRNKSGDAHGRGPNKAIPVGQSQAEHMIHMTSAHMLLIANLAGLR